MDEPITRPLSEDATGVSASPGSSFAIELAFCADLPQRTGQYAVLEDLGTVYTLGRGAAARGEVPVEFGPWHPVDRRKPTELDIDTISRRMLQLTRQPLGLQVKLLGRGHMRINGQPATEGFAAIGATIAIDNRLLLRVTVRSLRLTLRHFPLHLLGPFGQPDAFDIVGESEVMMRLRDAAALAAQGDLHVMVLGETGSGKLALARLIHVLSARSKGPFVEHNAASLSDELAQAELFGNEKNFPNPPMDPRPGLVLEADGGTLFLDEIGELSHKVQAKLLSVLDKGGKLRHLGGKRTLTSDFRMVGATNQPLAKQRADFVGRFKAHVEVPNLRAHAEDIPLLAQHRARDLLSKAPKMAERFIEKLPDGGSWVRIAPDLLEALMLAEHPLNVRGLDAVLWAAMGRSDGSWIRPSPEQLAALMPLPKPGAVNFRTPEGRLRDLTPEEVTVLRRRIDGTYGCVARAAAAMDVSRHQLRRAMTRYGISEPRGVDSDDAP